jgi:hypothetical protein
LHPATPATLATLANSQKNWAVLEVAGGFGVAHVLVVQIIKPYLFLVISWFSLLHSIISIKSLLQLFWLSLVVHFISNLEPLDPLNVLM